MTEEEGQEKARGALIRAELDVKECRKAYPRDTIILRDLAELELRIAEAWIALSASTKPRPGE